jgi:6-phosphogluconolactonase
MASTTEHRFTDGARALEALVASIAGALERAIALRGRASLVVPGGTSARALLPRLAQAAIPWRCVTATLTDERWVAGDDPASNERRVRETLLVGAARALRWIGLKSAALEPAEAARAGELHLQAVPRPFDVVVLGMGEDGHVASLFPGAPGLREALALANPRACQAIRPPAAPHARLTLTLAALLDSRHLMLLIAGPEKWRTYERARSPGPLAELPVRGILHQDRVPVDVVWAPALPGRPEPVG